MRGYSDIKGLRSHKEYLVLVLVGTCTILPILAILLLGSASGSVVRLDEKAESGRSPETPNIALKRELNEADKKRYIEIYKLQVSGKWKKADKLIALLENKVLLGSVYYQRYMHPTKYRSSYSELASWLRKYGEEAGAKAIYKLARRRAGKNKVPSVRSPLGEKFRELSVSSKGLKKKRAISRYEQRLHNKVRSLVYKGYVTRAYELLNKNKERLGELGYANIVGEIGRGYYHYYYDQKSISVAEKLSVANSMAYWWGGLAAFRQGDYGKAGRYFVTVGNNQTLASPIRAGGYYWGQRSYLNNGESWRSLELLRKASKLNGHSFYGLLARHALDSEIEIGRQLPKYSAKLMGNIYELPVFRRYLALRELGRMDEAYRHIDRVRVVGLQEAYGEQFLLLGLAAQDASMSLKFAEGLQFYSGKSYDRGLYPFPIWHPREGYKLRRALLYAFMRQESRFKPTAVSSQKAVGLMQLLPSTASLFSIKKYSRYDFKELFQPSLNLQLGQKYLLHLMSQEKISSNLLFVGVAYNGGSGNLRKWLKVKHKGDPLLFMESIPSRETRNFIENIFANYWIYGKLLGESDSTLEDFLSNRWPLYEGGFSDKLLSEVAK